MAVDLTVAAITVAVLMAVAAADMAGIDSRQRTAHLGIHRVAGLGSQKFSTRFAQAVSRFLELTQSQKYDLLAKEKKHMQPIESKKPRILVIDDEEWLREMIRNALHQKGCEVIEASDGTEGIEKARKEIPDLILSDINIKGSVLVIILFFAGMNG